ncbi:hypothetical protein AB6713_16065 [Luteimonas sp. B3_2_R+30]|uniref:Uncharacterized protein n=2 Tax=Luteimonas salinilitoris TaxID=3237697 RepID=A0ABV4HTN1_9GAMM
MAVAARQFWKAMEDHEMQRRTTITTLGTLFLLWGCGGSPGADPDASAQAGGQDMETSKAMEIPRNPAGGESVDTVEPTEDDSEVIAQIETLFSSSEEYKAAFIALQTAVAAGDEAAVSELVDFPLSISVDGRRVIMNPEQFVNEYDRIITPAIASTITTQKFSDVLVNTQGVMFGDGEVWLSGRCEDEACETPLVSISRIQEAPKGDVEFPLTVDIELSDAAAKRMNKDAETLMVYVSYFGFATPAAKDMADDLGLVDLGSASPELAPRSRQAVFDGSQFKRDRLQRISGGPRVNINVLSGRHSSEDNILDCDFYEDSLATATRSPIPLGCKLLRGE